MILISEKTCENCNEKYEINKKYCPNCGVRNNDYTDSIESINKIKKDMDSSKFFEDKIDDEIKNIDVDSFTDKAKIKFTSVKFEFEKTINETKNQGKVPKPSQENKPPKNKVICPKCNNQNDLSSRFCTECSFPLKDIKICPSCGFISEYGDLFCGECGDKLSEIKICPDCGVIMEIDAEFCGKCGYNFK